MATRPNTKPDTATEEVWEDVPTEEKVNFTKIGDEFKGTFNGWSETASGIPQAHYINDDGEHFVNCGASLKRQLRNAKKGETHRLTYVSDLDTGKETPMQVFKVAVKRS